MFGKEKRYSFRKGLPKKVFSTPYFTLRYGKVEGNLAKRAVVVSKKVSKKSVIRNKIKRKILVLLEEYLEDKEFDVVVYVKPSITEAEEDLIINTIKDAASKIKWKQ